MSNEFRIGQRVRSTKPGGGNGTVVDSDEDASQVIAPPITYRVRWDDGSVEPMLRAYELEVVMAPPKD